MSHTVQLYDQYIKTLKKCYNYKNKQDFINLLNEIGALRGLAKALEIYNVEVKNLEYLTFIKLQKKLIKLL